MECFARMLLRIARNVNWSERALVKAPGRALRPVAQSLGGPGGGFIRVTGGAGIWDFVLVCHGRGDEGESVSANFDVGDSGLDLRHVAGEAERNYRCHEHRGK